MRKGLALFGIYTGFTPGMVVQRDLISARVIPSFFVLGGDWGPGRWYQWYQWPGPNWWYVRLFWYLGYTMSLVELAYAPII